MNKKICEYGSILVLVMYACNELFSYFGISNLRYILGLIVIISGIITVFKDKILLRKLWPFYVFVLYGITLGIFSLETRGIILSVMGWTAIFFNLLVWLCVCEINDNWDNLFNRYKKTYVYCMGVNAVLAVYQYFFDASIFGLVSNKIYGSESSFVYGGITRRATALIGSTQNFAMAMGVALFLAYDLYKKKKCPLWLLGIILIGGCFSGGRTYGIFLVLFFVVVLRDHIRKAYVTGGVLLVGGMVVISGILKINAHEVLARLFTFHRWAALQVFISAIKDLTWNEIIFGRGFGLDDWTYHQRVIGFDYSSVESFMLALLYQGGVLFLGIFLGILVFAVLKVQVTRWEEWCLLAGIIINMAFTPSFAGFPISYLVWPIILNFYMRERQNSCLIYKHI